MESIIEVQDVTKSFKGATVLRQINISFEKGKIHGIIGRNGSGKTVLIKTICGLIHPDQGKVIVDGKVIGKDVDFPESIGAIIEAPGFLPSVSAFRPVLSGVTAGAHWERRDSCCHILCWSRPG